mmetsp:Transcript_3943/g.7567  ORF Transcript_3943/g.7567 Transcript_3943/m.7567 type:complete len:235 (+) Transcript_3943:1838-2542(+)
MLAPPSNFFFAEMSGAGLGLFKAAEAAVEVPVPPELAGLRGIWPGIALAGAPPPGVCRGRVLGMAELPEAAFSTEAPPTATGFAETGFAGAARAAACVGRGAEFEEFAGKESIFDAPRIGSARGLATISRFCWPGPFGGKSAIGAFPSVSILGFLAGGAPRTAPSFTFPAGWPPPGMADTDDLSGPFFAPFSLPGASLIAGASRGRFVPGSNPPPTNLDPTPTAGVEASGFPLF